MQHRLPENCEGQSFLSRRLTKASAVGVWQDVGRGQQCKHRDEYRDHHLEEIDRGCAREPAKERVPLYSREISS